MIAYVAWTLIALAVLGLTLWCGDLAERRFTTAKGARS